VCDASLDENMFGGNFGGRNANANVAAARALYDPFDDVYGDESSSSD